MNQRLFALPILPGKTAQARAFLRALEGERREEFAACQARLGVTKKVWAIQAGPQGDTLICYYAAADVDRVAAAFPSSRETFDVWYDAQMTEAVGPKWGGRISKEIVADFHA